MGIIFVAPREGQLPPSVWQLTASAGIVIISSTSRSALLPRIYRSSSSKSEPGSSDTVIELYRNQWKTIISSTLPLALLPGLYISPSSKSEPASSDTVIELYRNQWKIKYNLCWPDDQIHPHRQRHQQIAIFWLKTGHCRLRVHLYRLGLSHAHSRLPVWDRPLHPPVYKETRTQHWYQGATLAKKLCGSKEDLIQTTDLYYQYIHHQAR